MMYMIYITGSGCCSEDCTLIMALWAVHCFGELSVWKQNRCAFDLNTVTAVACFEG